VDQPEALFKAIAEFLADTPHANADSPTHRNTACGDRPLMVEWFQAFADGAIAPFVPVHPICLTNPSGG